MFEAIGYVAFPLALCGLWRLWPRRIADASVLLLAPFVLQCLLVPLLRSNVRFLTGYGVLLLPLAGVGAAWAVRASPAVRARPVLASLLVFTVFAGDIMRIPRARRANRIVLRELGEHLRPTLRAGENVATDMPRLAYFLGLPPIPPRRIDRAEILASCKDPRTRFAIVIEPRTGVSADDLRATGLVPVELPDRLRELAARRQMLVFGR